MLSSDAGVDPSAPSRVGEATATDDPVVQDILAVAMAEFAQLGLAGARVDAIAAQTKTSKRMIYYHFGSKEGLYQAVLEHAFQSVRFREDGFDAYDGTPLEALARFAEIAFDSLSQRPDFVRLLTLENLGGANHIKQSKLITRLNERGLGHMAIILQRGQLDATLRSGVTALDVYINLVGLCFYHVANRAGWVAGFEDAVKDEVSSEAFNLQRRNAVVEATTRYAMALETRAKPAS